ncbi:histidine acid phosphatase [Streptomyces sp. NRRL B-1568]|nr:histidine acid phosphatase [Streptomyces sp. NRRL B-1568]
MKHTASLVTALAIALVTVVPSGDTAAAHAGGDFYGTRTPYEPRESPDHYQRAPRGFVPVFTQNVARHGSRAMTDSSDGDAVLAVLRRAQTHNALTGRGAKLGPQVQTLLSAASAIGYGHLAGRGAQEHRQTALRMEQRLPSLFHTITAQHEPIVVETSGSPRAVASARAFAGALIADDPALADVFKAPVTDKDLLYFHKQPQNADYQAYLAGDPDLAAVLAAIDHEPRTARTARHVLSRLFDDAFTASMPAGEQVSFARSLYQLYSAAPDLKVEAPRVDLTPFLTSHDAQWLAYLDDAEEFYRKGPAFSGRTITYKMANVLLDDLFAQTEAKAAGTSRNGAVLRFTHAEEIEPLAVLLNLPGSTKPAQPGRPYSYRNNPWRGDRVAPMAANIQWDLYANATTYLVRMLYNEKEAAFKPSCKPMAKGSYFYNLTELKRCFNRG